MMAVSPFSSRYDHLHEEDFVRFLNMMLDDSSSTFEESNGLPWTGLRLLREGDRLGDCMSNDIFATPNL